MSACGKTTYTKYYTTPAINVTRYISITNKNHNW